MVCLLGLSLALLSTGCMTSPGHNQWIDDESDPVQFSGFLLDGNEWVKIQAKHPTNGWTTIGWTKSGTTSYHWSDSDWYSWNKSIVIPASYWTYGGSGYTKAEVRAIQYSNNQNLATFENGFSGYWDYTETLGDLWMDHGHGNSVTIYAGYPVIY